MVTVLQAVSEVWAGVCGPDLGAVGGVDNEKSRLYAPVVVEFTWTDSRGRFRFEDRGGYLSVRLLSSVRPRSTRARVGSRRRGV